MTRGKSNRLRALAPVFVTGLALLAPGSAGAATLDVDGGNIFYTADAGETNGLVITQSGGAYIFDEPFDGVVTGTINHDPDHCHAIQPPDPGYVSCTPPVPLQNILVSLGDGDDAVTSGVPVDHNLIGGAGNDVLTAGPNGDALFGNDGADTLNGGGGDDQFRGDDGLDGTPSVDTIAGQDGPDDVVFYDQTATPLAVDLEAGTGGEFGAMDALSGVENVFGNGSLPNNLAGDAQDNDLVGGSDVDHLDGRGGGDTLVAHGNADTLIAGADAQHDSLLAGAGADELFAADGTGTVDGLDCGTEIDSVEADPVDSIDANCENVDTDVPLPPAVTVSSGPATNDTTPNLAGSASDNADDGATITVEIYSGTSASGTPVRTFAVTRAGTSWSVSDADYTGGGGALSPGVYTATASQDNPNATPHTGTSDPRQFQVDTTAPIVELSNPVDNSTTTSVRPAITGTAGIQAGLSPDGHITFELRQHLPDGTNPHVNKGPIVNGFWQIPNASPFNTTIPTDLGPGTYHLRAYQSDAAGNNNPQDTRTSRLFTVVVSDTTPPAVTVNAISLTTNGHTNDSTPLFSGEAGNAAGDDAEVRVLVDKLINGVYENQGNRLVTRNGGSWAINWPDTLSDGPWRVRVEQEDAANNDKTVETTFTVDTKAPTLSMFYPSATAPYTHYKQGEETIVVGLGSKDGNERSEVTGELSLNQPGGFQLKKNRDQVKGTRFPDGSWVINLGVLAPGHWFMRIYLQDQAGNEGNVPVQWFVDANAKPIVTVHTPRPNDVYHVGQTVTPNLDCSDPEDGVLPCDYGPSPLITTSPGERTFGASARDKNGQTTSVTVPYKVIPRPADQGIRVDGIELTQGTQTYGLETPDSALLRKARFGFALRQANYLGVNVVPNKATLARVFFESDRRVNGFLYVFNGNKLAAGPLSPLPHAVNTGNKSANDKQSDLNGGLLFSIPPSAVTTDTMEVVATVIPNTTATAESCDDCRQVNGFALTNIKPKSARGFKFAMLQVNIKDNDPPSVIDDLKKALDIFPVDPTKVTIPAKYKAVIDGDDIKGTTTARQGTILDRLDAWDEAQGENLSQSSIGIAVPPRTHLAGGVADGEVVFTPKVCTTGGGFLGIGQTTSCAYKRGDIVVGAQERWYTSVGHELGHALAREHASAGCKGADNGQIAEPWPDPRGRMRGIGFDVQATLNGSPRILDGRSDKIYDFMSYCAPNNNGEIEAWTSPKGWESLFETLHSGTLPAVGGLSTVRRGRAHASAGQPAVVVRAIDYGDSAQIVSVAPGVGTQGPAGSPYRVAIHDKSGKLLGTAPMKVRVLHADDGSGKTFVVAETTVPSSAAESLTVLNPAGKAIATETRSPNAPKVAVTAPKKGARVGGTRKVKLAWTATDADGGELLSTVEYSTNGGKRWNEVVAGTTARSISLDPAFLGASKNARIRVRTNDGWNETSATSGKFTSLGAPPAIEILAPTRRLRANNDQIVSLVATATDDLNRQLTGKAITWRAGNRVVGRGERTSVAGLKAGRVKLTATARDRLGRTSVASVRIRLGQSVPRFLKLAAPKKVSARARKITLRAATTVPATLRAGGRRYPLDRRTRRITVAISPSKRQLVLQLNLKAGSKRSKAILVVKRG